MNTNIQNVLCIIMMYNMTNTLREHNLQQQNFDCIDIEKYSLDNISNFCNENTICPICLEYIYINFGNNELIKEIAVFPCKHNFCTECIREWFRVCVNNCSNLKCPVCRRVVV
jgi:hypothetical protein